MTTASMRNENRVIVLRVIQAFSRSQSQDTIITKCRTATLETP